jgi:ribonuclease P protein component
VLTLTSSSEIDALFKTGRRGGTELLVVLKTQTPQGRGPQGRVLFVAGKKLGDAVMRNRCKRVMREAVRRVGGPWPGSDVAVMARAGVATASPAAIDASLVDGLRRAGVTR